MRMGDVYAEGRLRLSELLADVSDEQAASPVPTCPGWSVADVVAHLAGTCADVLAGRLEGLTTDAWTDAQVSARRGRSLAEVLAEWAEVGPQVEALAERFPGPAATQWVMDLTTHEHDVRAGLGRPGARDSEGVRVGLDFLVTLGLSASVAARDLPALEVRADEDRWVAGKGEPVVVVQAAPFELFRALTGRRSAAQIRTLDWSSDPAPYLPAFRFGPFRTSDRDVDE